MKLLVAMVALLTVLASASQALGSPLRQLARSTTSFAADGERYAAWQLHAGAPIVVLDTLTGSRQTIAPAGCELMRDQNEAGEPSATAADGRFLLDCVTPAHVESQEVLDLGTPGTFVMLPNGAGFALSRPWTALGTRYVQGTAAPEECSHGAGEHEPCIALFDLATGAISYRPPSQVLNLDLPGAPQICPVLRSSLRAQLRQVLPEQLAFQDGVFARPTINRHNIRIERCNGRSTLLRGPSEPAPQPGGVRHSEPRSFDLGAGLLTWDTAHNADGAEMNEQSNAHGTLSSYRLSTGRRQTWRLPRLPLLGAPNIDGSGPEVESPGVYGYSTHTANTVFWIATRTVKADAVTSGLTVETSSVYAASVKSVPSPPPAVNDPATVERMTIQRMDHVGIVVDDLATATAFFLELGLELQGEGSVEGGWVDRVVGLEGVRAQIAMLQTPDGHGRVELAKFHSPSSQGDNRFHAPSSQGGDQHAPANTPGIRHITFAVDDIDDVVARLQARGAELVGEVERYENIYRLCYIRGPEGIIVELAEKIG